MPLPELDGFPGEARVWIFESDRILSDSDARLIASHAETFVPGWAAHGATLRAGWELVYHRFLLIAVDESATNASGCSLDALTGFVRRVGEELGVSFLDRNSVTFREGNRIKRVTRAAFSELARAGAVDSSTPVFDNTLTSLAAMREGLWEVPAGESWHATLLG